MPSHNHLARRNDQRDSLLKSSQLNRSRRITPISDMDTPHRVPSVQDVRKHSEVLDVTSDGPFDPQSNIVRNLVISTPQNHRVVNTAQMYKLLKYNEHRFRVPSTPFPNRTKLDLRKLSSLPPTSKFMLQHREMNNLFQQQKKYYFQRIRLCDRKAKQILSQ